MTTQTAYAVLYRNADGTLRGAMPGKTPDCAVKMASPLEGDKVFGLATIRVEPEPIAGMRFVLREVGPNAKPEALAATDNKALADRIGFMVADGRHMGVNEMTINLDVLELAEAALAATPSAHPDDGEAFDMWWNSEPADSFRAAHEDEDGDVFRPVWDAAVAMMQDQAAVDKAWQRFQTAITTPSAQAGEVLAWAKASELEGLSKPLYGGRLALFVGQVPDGQCNVPLYTTPQPQGDASPNRRVCKVGGPCVPGREGPCMCVERADPIGAVATAATPEARPEDEPDGPCQEADGCPTERAVLQRFWRSHQRPAPTVDGGAVVEVRGSDAVIGGEQRFAYFLCDPFTIPLGTKLYTHPAPAPDVARLVEAAKDARFALYGTGPGNPALDAALAPFTANQQGATNGQD